MTLYLSANKIPALQPFNVQQRHAILSLAQAKLSAPEKFILNIIKLLLLIPPFFFIANLQGFAVFIAVMVVLVAYFILLKPILLFFSQKHLENAIAQYQKSEH
ncbi:MAG: DUF6170 family protein [Thalassotalea sp.]